MTKSMLFMFMHSKITAKHPHSRQKKNPETLINQGFRAMVGLVGLEPMTSTMSRSKIVHKNTLTTHNKRFKKRGYKALHICMVG